MIFFFLILGQSYQPGVQSVAISRNIQMVKFKFVQIRAKKTENETFDKSIKPPNKLLYHIKTAQDQ